MVQVTIPPTMSRIISAGAWKKQQQQQYILITNNINYNKNMKGGCGGVIRQCCHHHQRSLSYCSSLTTTKWSDNNNNNNNYTISTTMNNSGSSISTNPSYDSNNNNNYSSISSYLWKSTKTAALLRQPQRQLTFSSSIRQSSSLSTSSTTSSSSPSLYMWGTDTKGSLLNIQQENQQKNMIDIPTEVTNWKQSILQSTDNNVDEDLSIETLVCGPTDTAIILSNGKCYVCGENKHGQLGLGHKNPVLNLTEVVLPSQETSGGHIKQIALGNQFAAYVDNIGDLYTCGYGGSAFNGMGYLGHGNSESYMLPKLVESLVEDGCYVKKVVVGESHMTILTTEGEILTTGAGSYGRLGNFETIDQLYLNPIEILNIESNIIDIVGGKSFTLALTSDGIVYGWGRNHKGQLGTGLGLSVDMYAMQSVPEPIQSDELMNRKVIQIAAGHSHAVCITDSGELFYWGMAQYFEPIRIDTLLHTKISNISCGQDYTLIIDVAGNMYSMGNHGKIGVLGQGGTIKQLNQPTIMEAFDYNNIDKIQSFSAGWKHAGCLLTHNKK